MKHHSSHSRFALRQPSTWWFDSAKLIVTSLVFPIFFTDFVWWLKLLISSLGLMASGICVKFGLEFANKVKP